MLVVQPSSGQHGARPADTRAWSLSAISANRQPSPASRLDAHRVAVQQARLANAQLAAVFSSWVAAA
jgi:hypothetical protein